MFLYLKGNKRFNDFVDIFISSSIIFALIFNLVICIGYFCLIDDPHGCLLQPLLVTYTHCSGMTAIVFFIVLSIAVLSSHNPKEKCFDGDSETSSVGNDDRIDAAPISVIQSVNSTKLKQRNQDENFSLYSVSLISQDSSIMEETEWAGKVENVLIHLMYSLFFILHLGNLILGSTIIFPLFFELKLHLGKIIDENYFCSPSMFWFTFITISLEYFIIFIFAFSMWKIVCRKLEEENEASSFSYKLADWIKAKECGEQDQITLQNIRQGQVLEHLRGGEHFIFEPYNHFLYIEKIYKKFLFDAHFVYL